MDESAYQPTVVVSRDGVRVVELLEFLGTGTVPHRDAVGFTFSARTAPHSQPFRISVIFSGTTLSIGQPMQALGLPIENHLTQFIHFSEARIGEYLDQDGIPTPPEQNYYAREIECYSEQFEEWEERRPIPDDSVEEYIRHRLYAAWRFNHGAILFAQPDLVRLRVPEATLRRILELGESREWTLAEAESFGFKVKANSHLITAIREAGRQKMPTPVELQTDRQFISKQRIQELEELADPRFDLTRLLEMLRELNVCAANGCAHAVAMLTRAVLDHVPPIFELRTFKEVVSNHPGGKSFGATMLHLESSARKIADAHLHLQIREKEVLPTMVQVDFSRELDHLLGEVVRVLKRRSSAA